MTPGLYLAGGMALVAAIAVAWGAFERAGRLGAEKEVAVVSGQLESAVQAIGTLESTNRQLNRNIDRLLEQQVADQKLAADLARRVGDIAATVESARADIEELKLNDQESRDYLGVRVPGGVRQLLNKPALGRN
jgi:TolA-binding protein